MVACPHDRYRTIGTINLDNERIPKFTYLSFRLDCHNAKEPTNKLQATKNIRAGSNTMGQAWGYITWVV